MEAQLKEYRARQRRQVLLDTAKEQYEKSKAKLASLIIPKGMPKDMAKEEEEHEVLLQYTQDEAPPPPARRPIQPIHDIHLSDEEAASEEILLESSDDKEMASCRFCVRRWVIYISLWALVWGIFLFFQFGAVYFVVTALLGIYFNTRTTPKKKGEISAYSVFNPNCASIEGTLNPEQFEREIRYGMGNTRSYNV